MASVAKCGGLNTEHSYLNTFLLKCSGEDDKCSGQVVFRGGGD